MDKEEMQVYVDEISDEVANTINCECGEPVQCPPVSGCCNNNEKDTTFAFCEICKTDELSVDLKCLGRVLRLNVTINNVCPNKNVVVGILIFEDDKLKAVKVKEVNTCGLTACSPVKAGQFCFVFKEEDLCRRRTFTVKAIAHYTDIVC